MVVKTSGGVIARSPPKAGDEAISVPGQPLFTTAAGEDSVARFLKAFRKFEETAILNAAIFFFFVSFAWMFLEAIARQVFAHSFPESEEIVLFSLMWAILLSLAQGGRNGAHIRIDLFVGKLPSTGRKLLEVITSLLSLFYSSVILYSSIQVIPHLKRTGLVSYSPMELPMWIINLSILVGSLLLSFFYLESAVRGIMALRVKAEEPSVVLGVEGGSG